MDQNQPLWRLRTSVVFRHLGLVASRERAGFEVRDNYTHYGRLCTIETPEDQHWFDFITFVFMPG
jgi:DNA-directed RNA polymerase beta subunit